MKTQKQGTHPSSGGVGESHILIGMEDGWVGLRQGRRSAFRGKEYYVQILEGERVRAGGTALGSWPGECES